MAESTRCCKRAPRIAVWAGALLCASAGAQTPAPEPAEQDPPEALGADPDAQWLERSRQLLERAADAPLPGWLGLEPNARAVAEAEAIAATSARRAGGVSLEAEGFVAPAPPPDRVAPGAERVLVFGSLAMPDATLRNLLDQAAEPNAVFVLRGLADGADLRATQARIEALANIEQGRIPNVVIDPTLFRAHGVSVVPTLVLERATDRGEAIPVRVTGAVPVDWLRRRARRVSATEAVDLGRRAEVHPIAEVDLVLEMQRRIAQLDFEARREAAIERFWRRQSFMRLPDAPEDAVYEVDPTVRVTADITDLNGRVLVSAGERFNPLDAVPLTKTIVVFRGTDPRHRAKAAELATQVRREGRGVILMTTQIDAAEGWDGLRALETALQGPVYLLYPNVAERLRLRHVPAAVRAHGARLLVQEWRLAP